MTPIQRLVAAARALALAAFLAAPPLTSAHSVDPLERAPAFPDAATAAIVQLSGEVHDLLVDDRVGNATLRYRWLALSDGSAVMLRGAAAEGLAEGATVEATGRRNGRTLFVTGVRAIPPSPGAKAGRASGAPGYAEGELRLMHVDYFEDGRSHVAFEVLDDRGDITPLALPVHPEALQRGMRVRARGTVRSDGTIEPDTIEILALAPQEADAKVAAKATVTNSVLVILVRFADSAAAPFTQAQVQSTFGSVGAYFREVSYGQQLLAVTVTPWLASTSPTPASCDYRAIGTIARNAAAAAGYTTSAYRNLVYVFPRVSSCGWAGLAYIGASGVWSNGYNTLLVFAHELGHNLGLLHAASRDCGASSVGGSCSVAEYGDPFNVMGNQRAMHFNATQKSILGWIPSTGVATHAGGSATYSLSPIEAAGGGLYAVKVRAAANRTYWLEYRQPIGFDAGLASYPNNGAQVRVASPFESLCAGCDAYSDDTQMLDMTPATTAFTDATLVAGRSYTDQAYGVTFNVLSATASALTVQVVSGGSLAATTTALSSSSNPSLAGSVVSFTASVSGSAPTGTVSFTASGTAIAGCSSVALVGSGNVRTGVCSTSSLPAGTHAIVARYAGDAANQASTSTTLSQTVAAITASTNVALASGGATASASSVAGAGFPAAGAINNERAGTNWGKGSGGWADGTPGVWPDWIQVSFAGRKTIDRVVVYSVQDRYTSPVEPTDTMTFSLYGLRAFIVQGWNGTAWVNLATVSGNNLVKRAVTFPAYTTDRIRVHVTSALATWSRITEIEAWGR